MYFKTCNFNQIKIVQIYITAKSIQRCFKIWTLTIVVWSSFKTFRIKMAINPNQLVMQQLKVDYYVAKRQQTLFTC